MTRDEVKARSIYRYSCPVPPRLQPQPSAALPIPSLHSLTWEGVGWGGGASLCVSLTGSSGPAKGLLVLGLISGPHLFPATQIPPFLPHPGVSGAWETFQRAPAQYQCVAQSTRRSEPTSLLFPSEVLIVTAARSCQVGRRTERLCTAD